ncbi:hypothetical protein [Armatimonas sp.]|uniref:hypothetical protein n=1 Tax=Armatimonas sp. TaxID=1872638 RepID=UPI003750BEB1
MYRGEVVVRAMLPMALVVWLIHWRLMGENVRFDWGDYLLPVLAAYVLGRGVVRREKARLCELLAGLLLASVVFSAFVASPYIILASLFLGSVGLFLLPVRCSALRESDPESAVAMPETRNTALAFVAILCLISVTCGVPWQEAILWGAMIAMNLCIPVLIIALGCVLGGKTRVGASIGAVAALVMTIFLVLLIALGIRLE